MFKENNVERFSEFADLYDKYRPEAPLMVQEILVNYLKRKPSLVVDLGCGTGLSTFGWAPFADKVIGIEPNEDMIKKARGKLSEGNELNKITFAVGFSDHTNLDSSSVDIITCSQSFHWMEPISTLDEVSRILVDGGIFAAYDVDWPPSVDWVVENEYIKLRKKADKILEDVANENKVKHWNKQEHLNNIRKSNKFRYSNEIVFHNKEKSDAERFIGIALSQGGIQSVLKAGINDLDEDLDHFKKVVEDRFNNKELDILFSYRMRLGVK